MVKHVSRLLGLSLITSTNKRKEDSVGEIKRLSISRNEARLKFSIKRRVVAGEVA